MARGVAAAWCAAGRAAQGAWLGVFTLPRASLRAPSAEPTSSTCQQYKINCVSPPMLMSRLFARTPKSHPFTPRCPAVHPAHLSDPTSQIWRPRQNLSPFLPCLYALSVCPPPTHTHRTAPTATPNTPTSRHPPTRSAAGHGDHRGAAAGRRRARGEARRADRAQAQGQAQAGAYTVSGGVGG